MSEDAARTRMLLSQRIAVVINVEGGKARRVSEGALAEELNDGFSRPGIRAELTFVGGAEVSSAVARALDRVQRREFDAVAVGGGDGTLRAAAAILAGTGVPLAVLPLGTLNHFARDIGILTLPDAWAALAAGQLRSIDMAEVNGAIFLNTSSIGLYPLMVLDRERQRRNRGRSKWVAMLVAGWRVLRRLPLYRLRLVAEGGEGWYRTPLLFIGNNEYRLHPFDRRESLEGGSLSISVARHQDPLSLVWLGLRSLFGWVREGELVTIIAKSAEVISRRRRMLVALDGEVEVLQPPLSYRLRPAALKVFVPALPSVRPPG